MCGRVQHAQNETNAPSPFSSIIPAECAAGPPKVGRIYLRNQNKGGKCHQT